MSTFGYFLSCEEYAPDQISSRRGWPRRPGSTRSGSATTTTRGTTSRGSAPFVWSMIGALSQVVRPAGDDRRHLPDAADPPGGDRPGRGDQCRAPRRGPVPRSGSGPGRRSTSTCSATPGRRPRSGWRCSRRPSRSCARSGRARPCSHRGRHYTVENARIYTRPTSRRRSTSRPSAQGRSTWLCRIGDGYVTTTPDEELLGRSAKRGRRRQADRRPASRWRGPTPRTRASTHAYRLWANSGLPGELAQVLPTVSTSSRRPQLVTRTRSPSRSSAVPTSRRHLEAMRRSSTPASTRSTSPTWGRTTPT